MREPLLKNDRSNLELEDANDLLVRGGFLRQVNAHPMLLSSPEGLI